MRVEPQASLYLNALHPFSAGKSPEEYARDFQIPAIIRLDSNENPRGPSPSALTALHAVLESSNRYPDSASQLLKNGLGDFNRVKSGQIAIGNGSNEIIDLIIRAFCFRPQSILISKSAFIAYRMCANQQNIEVEEVEMKKAFQADLDALAHQARRSSQVKIIFLANPNNPTGTYHSKNEMRSFLKKITSIREGSILVVIDAAYSEYARASDYEDPLVYLNEFKNCVVLKTFSKAYGLAGLRVGYAIGEFSIIEAIEKVRQPYHVNSLAQAGACAALADQDYMHESTRLNAEGMDFWEQSLIQLEIPFIPSQGNFILINTQKGMGLSGTEVFKACLLKGVAFRPVANYGLPEMLRVSIGNSGDNLAGVQAIDLVKRAQTAL